MKIAAIWQLAASALMLTVAAVPAGAQPPAPEPPRRVLAIGDSMMQLTAHALRRELDRRPEVEVRTFTSLGSGMARLDVFDWMEKIRELVAEFDPDATLAWFGANDLQAMQTADGVVRPGTPEWDAEYGRRIGTAMDMLAGRPGARVYWLELPDMRESRIQGEVALINRLLETAAEARARAFFLPTRPLLSRRPGTYSPFIVGPRGLPLQVRDPDGVHLNRAGADMIVEHLIKHLLESE